MLLFASSSRALEPLCITEQNKTLHIKEFHVIVQCETRLCNVKTK